MVSARGRTGKQDQNRCCRWRNCPADRRGHVPEGTGRGHVVGLGGFPKVCVIGAVEKLAESSATARRVNLSTPVDRCARGAASSPRLSPAVSPTLAVAPDGRLVVVAEGRRLAFAADELAAMVADGGSSGVVAALRERGQPATGPDEGPHCPLVVGEYTVTGILGEGSFGRVVRAFDPVAREDLAIKLLHVDDPASRLALRNELRYLAGIDHPGLLCADELLVVGSQDALVMPMVVGGGLDHALRTAAGVAGPIADDARFTALVVELLDAVDALHRADVLHMDLKPSNVLVDHVGRVRILDFGLSRLRGRALDGPSGTLRYMAPEAMMGAPPEPPVDLYAIGVILFEALTGEQVHGDAADLVYARLRRPAAPLASRRPGIDPAWSTIVDGLLQIDPARRPTAEALLDRLAGDRSRRRWGLPFVGREAELRELRARWAAAARGRSGLVQLRGEPGVGKSQLLRRFVRALQVEGEVQVAWGRVHERDATRYRALDGVIDQVGELLRGSPALAAGAAAIPHFGGLAQIFPGLALDELAEASVPVPKRPERLLARVLELLTRERPLLLVIDDVQWGDADSAELLLSVFAEATSARVLVVLAGRAEASPFTAAIDASLARGPGIASVGIELGPLAVDQGRAFLEAVAEGETDRAVLDALVERCGGLPRRLERCAVALAGGAAPVELDVGVGRRLDDLEPGLHGLFERLAAARGPLSAAVLAAAGASIPDRARLRALAVEGLVMVRGSAGVRELALGYEMSRGSCLKDSDREAELLRRLAAALIDRGGDAAAIVEHLVAAGDRAAARSWALRAADEAEAARAFERAAELLAAIDDGDGKRPLRRRRAELLLAAGRGREGATLLLEQVEGEPNDRLAAADRRRAAEALMASGAVEEGLGVLAPVLRALALPRPALGLRGAVRLLRSIVGALVRDPGVLPSAVDDPTALARAEVCWSAGKVIAFSEPMLGLDLCLQAIVHGRAGGSRSQVAAPMGFLASTLLIQLPLVRGVGERWLAEIDAWSATEPGLGPLGPLFRGLAALSRGQVVRACDESRRALDLLGEAPWAAWERSIAVNSLARALRSKGEMIACRELTRSHRREAERRGDLYVQVMTTDYSIIPLIAAGELGEARARIAWIRGTWQPDRYTVQRAYIDLYGSYATLYEGRPDDALAELEASARAFREAGGERIAFGRIDRRLALARASIAAGAAGAARAIGQLRGESWPEATGNAELLAAGLAARRGDQAAALAGLERALAILEEAELSMDAAVARLRRANLTGDAEAAEAARREMRRLGADEPERWAAVIAPGFDRDHSGTK